MGNLPLVIGAAVVLAAIVVGVFLARRRPASASPSRGSDEAAAWGHYLGQPETWLDDDREAIEALRRLPEPERDRVKAAVFGVEASALAAPDPQTALRRAVMDATDRFVLAEAHGPGDFESVIEAGVLRRTALLRFDDYAKDDWYAHYLGVARMNARNVATMVRKTVAGRAAAMESALHDPLTRTMAEVRRTLLTHPPRTAVARSDKLTSAAESKRLTPTQREVDALTRLMGERFTKLFSGQIYRLEQTNADPAGTFQVDAGLLYTLLAVNFRHPTDAWRHIMVEALGDYRSAMVDEERLLSLAQDCCRSWERHREDGGLHELLKTGCRGAFPEDAGREAIAVGMMEDATFLSGQIQSIVTEK